jgi:hypothetical protein
MPRKKNSQGLKALARLDDLGSRLELLGKAGLSQGRRAALLAKAVGLLEELLDNPQVDPFARIAAAKSVIRDVAGVAPSKTTSGERAPQAPVTIVLPDYIGRAPRTPAPRAVGASSTVDASQPRVDA